MSLLSDVSSWIYHLGDVSASAAEDIATSGAGLVVVDYSTYTDGAARPYSEAEIDGMRGGDDTLVVSYISVGEAEDYRDYWQDDWSDNPPDFLSASNPEWPDNYKVKFWEPEWQDIVFDNVRDIVDSGFNGLYLDIIDSYYFWNDVAPNTGIDYEASMAEFVADIREVAEARLAEIGETDRNFVVIGQNGEELVLQPEYLAAVDGIAKEDLAFYYSNGNEGSFREVPQGWYDGSTELLEAAQAAGVEVFVVEYMTQDRQSDYADELSDLHEYLSAEGMPLYIAEDRDLTEIYQQPFASPPDVEDSLENETPPADDGTPVDNETPPVDDATPPADDTTPPADDEDPLEDETPVEDETPPADDEAPADEETPPSDEQDGEAVPPEHPEEEPGSGGEPDETDTTSDENEDTGGSVFEDPLVAGIYVNGGRGAEELFGLLGDDTIIARGGDDLLEGLEGNDLLKGGRGMDDLLGGEDSDTLHGGGGHDFLSGDEGDDRLFGGKGHDELHGGEGNDVMSGGAGWDLYFFEQTSGHDRITDFELGKDQIVLEGNPLEMRDTDTGLLILISEESSVKIDGIGMEDIEEEDFFF